MIFRPHGDASVCAAMYGLSTILGVPGTSALAGTTRHPTRNGDAVTTLPPTLLPDGIDAAAPPQRAARAVRADVRVVTAAQVDRAVPQLREHPGQAAVEQVQAVLRALELTVVLNPVIPEPRVSPGP